MITILADSDTTACTFAADREYTLVRSAKQLFNAPKDEVHVLQAWTNMLPLCQQKKMRLMLLSLKVHPTAKVFRYDTIQ